MLSPNNQDAPEPVIEETQAPAPRKRSLFGRLASGPLLLAAVAGGGAYAAILFQDQDLRLKMVAEHVEDGVAKARGIFASLTGGAEPVPYSKITTRRTAIGEEPAAEAQPAPAPESKPQEAAEPAQLDAEAVRKAEKDAEEAVKDAEAKALEKAQAEARAAEEKARAEAQAAESRAAEEKRAAEEQAAREAAERAAREKTSAAETGQRVVATQTDTSGDFTDRELITGLEGRIDELGNEIQALRARLDAPKNETRAAPEATAEKPASADNSAAKIVVAYTLQRQLEAGKPFADQIAALTRLGVDGAALEALTPLSEKGAPTAQQLRADFSAIAKTLRAPEPSSDRPGDLTEQLSKLVKVHPHGQAGSSAGDGTPAAQIDAALAHNDFEAAQTAFETLPEAARTEAKSFGEALPARIEADKAAESILHAAIAALGAKQ